MVTNKVLIMSGGGFDTAALMHRLKKEDKEVAAIFFDYGQRTAEFERYASHNLIEMFCFDYIEEKFFIRDTDTPLISGVEDKERILDMKHYEVKNRNIKFLIRTFELAEILGINIVAIPFNKDDHLLLADADVLLLEEFTINYNSLNRDNDPIFLYTPFSEMTKAEVYKEVKDDGVMPSILSATHSCFNADRTPHDWGHGCGMCIKCNDMKNLYIEV